MNKINMKKYDEFNFRKKRTENDNNWNKYLNLEDENAFINDKNMNLFLAQSDCDKNKYPDYKSFLQTNPKDEADIPSIKYYNYIFNIGSPFN